MKPDNVSKQPHFLPILRQDLQLLPGPPAADGSPCWSLHDRVRNTFFRLGWLEFAMLSRWSVPSRPLITPAELVEQVNRETTLKITESDIISLERFLLVNSLLEARDPESLALLHSRMTQKIKLGRWLLHNYLFFRIPLFSSDRFLEATLPIARLLVSRIFITMLGSGALLGIYLISRQWQVFVHTFPSFFTARGFLLYGLTMVGVKLFHELGHAYTAKFYGVKVPTMGVAFLVLWPLLYSDTTESWKLSDRKKRMAIVAAGGLTELGLAVPATLLWNFLPDSPLRSACFLVATVTWITSILWNLNPFMRFDGYFLLADYLDIANLQDRSFAMGKWHLRKILLGVESPMPDDFGPRRNHLVIAYAYGVWIYRFFLFTAIALTVYHLFFKVLGLFLFGVEIVWFLILPVCREIKSWWLIREEIGSCRHNLIISLLVCSLLLGLLIIPWPPQIQLPAMLNSKNFRRVFSPIPARIEKIHVKNGQTVQQGEILFTMSNPQIDYNLTQTTTLCRDLEKELQRLINGNESLEYRHILESRLTAALTELAGYRKQQQQLNIKATITGTVFDLAKGLRPGLWLGDKQLLALVVDRSQPIIETFIDENRLETIKNDSQGLFYPDNGSQPVSCKVNKIDPLTTVFLDEPYLASIYGGEIRVKPDEGKRMRLTNSMYRIMLDPDQLIRPDQVIRGKIVLTGKKRSILKQYWRQVVAVFIRESGF
jgi:putative peptide zinc metalloprotease protein